MEVAMTTIGLTTVRSEFGPTETMARLEAGIKAARMSVFAKIDHSIAAADVDMALRSTEVVIFGNAKGGTLLMQARQPVAIDLPLKALVYQDASGRVFVAYNDPHWIAERHGLGEEVASIVDEMAAALKIIVANTTQIPIKD
jgi:uncharacterized protein (DUF302 family)